MGLKALNLQIQYRSEEDDIVRDFYQKVIKVSTEYKRAVGYFSTQSLLLLGDAIDEFMTNSGRMQLIASPNLSSEDIELIKNAYDKRKKFIESRILSSLVIPEDDVSKRQLAKIERMIELGILDIRIAFRNSQGIFHEKIGIVSDGNNDKVAFNGSINETHNGYCENFESIDLYFSWDERDKMRIDLKEKNFDMLWNNQTNNLEVYDFNEAIQRKLIAYQKEGLLPVIEDNPDTEFIDPSEPSIPKYLRGNIRPYQLEAFSQWVANDYHGILQMATGTGKTITACYSLVQLFNEMKAKKQKQIVLVLVPYKHLVNQWVEELSNFSYEPLKVYSDVPNWDRRLNKEYQRLNLDAKRNHLSVVTTNDSFKTERFQNILKIMMQRYEIILVADEAHNLGAESNFKNLSSNIRYRLGLTATPIRHNDESGTRKLIDYFSQIVFKYDLEDAINNGYLTPYYYYPILVYLDEVESNQYYNILNEFKGYSLQELKRLARTNTEFKEVIRLTYQIADGSINKFKAFKDKISEYKDTHHNLIYCTSVPINDGETKFPIKQINAINVFMGKELNMRVHTFTAQEDMETRQSLIKRFTNGNDLQGLVAIKCLDEGVDIPATRRAFILSSTTNEKQFIQRRGRILRKAEGKEYAEIFDFVTLPRNLSKVMRDGITSDAEIFLILKEYNRIKEFSRLAINSDVGMDLATDLYDVYDLSEYILQEI